MICRYKYCMHEDKEVDITDCEYVGKSYYHKDCFMEKTTVDQIMSLFVNEINKNVVYAQLRSVVNNIVYTKGFPADKLLFGLQYYIDKKIPLNYPQGLYYVIQNKGMNDAYNSLQANEIKKKMNNIITNDEMNLDASFNYNPGKKKTIGDIFGDEQ